MGPLSGCLTFLPSAQALPRWTRRIDPTISNPCIRASTSATTSTNYAIRLSATVQRDLHLTMLGLCLRFCVSQLSLTLFPLVWSRILGSVTTIADGKLSQTRFKRPRPGDSLTHRCRNTSFIEQSPKSKNRTLCAEGAKRILSASKGHRRSAKLPKRLNTKRISNKNQETYSGSQKVET